MKNFLLTIAFAACFSQPGYSQKVRMDSTFSEDGSTIGSISTSQTHYGRIITSAPNDKIIVSGKPLSAPSNSQNLDILRYTADGLIDPDFLFEGHSKFKSYGGAVVGTQSDGKILSAADYCMIRLQLNGLPDSTFGQNGWVAHSFSPVEIIALPNGRIIVAGDRTNDPVEGIVVRVYQADGTLDSTFSQDGIFSYLSPTTFNKLSSAKVQPDGKILLAGIAEIFDSTKLFLFRLTENGTFDQTFGNNGFIIESINQYDGACGLAVQPDGKIILTGSSLHLGQQRTGVILRYLPDGTRDPSFGVGGLRITPEFSRAMDVLVRPSGETLILGEFFTVITFTEDTSEVSLLMLRPDGTQDSTFGENGIFKFPMISSWFGAMAMVPVADNKVAIGRLSYLDKKPVIIQQVILDLNVGTLNPTFGLQERALIYPNPIAEQFTLRFALHSPEKVTIDLFDMTGKLIKRLAQEQLFVAGEHNESFSIGQEMPSGNYILAISLQGKTVSNVQIVKK